MSYNCVEAKIVSGHPGIWCKNNCDLLVSDYDGTAVKKFNSTQYFKIILQPDWINENATTQEIIDQVAKCPSGALSIKQS